LRLNLKTLQLKYSKANPDLYEIKEKKKAKKLYIDPITGKTVV